MWTDATTVPLASRRSAGLSYLICYLTVTLERATDRSLGVMTTLCGLRGRPSPSASLLFARPRTHPTDLLGSLVYMEGWQSGRMQRLRSRQDLLTLIGTLVPHGPPKQAQSP